MSFSTEFVATSKVKALAAIKTQSLPESVRAFLQVAIENLPAGKEERERFISVKANGHLADSAGSYSVSSASIEVREILPNV